MKCHLRARRSNAIIPMRSGNVFSFSISAACMQKEEDLIELKANCHKEIERIATKYLTRVTQDPNTPPSAKSKEARAYAAFLDEIDKYLGSGSGCLLFWVTLASLQALESLWKKSSTGALTIGFQREIITEECLRNMSLISIKIQVHMREEDYLKAKGRLQAGNFCWRKTRGLASNSSPDTVIYLW